MMHLHRDAVSSKPILQGEYKLLKVLQKLSYSTYYLGTSLYDPAKRWAIKEVRLEFDSPSEKHRVFLYFEGQADKYLNLKHPLLVPLTDYFFEKGMEYLVFEFVPGHRLKEIIDLRKKPFNEFQTLDLAKSVAGALDCLHGQGILFHDLNPSNIIITPEGTIKLTDYGLGKIIARREIGQPLWGTMGYAPPEQFGERPVLSKVVDIYALGVIMHQMLTFWDPTLSRGVLPPLTKLNPQASREMENLIKNATDENPGHRYPNIRAFLKDLNDLMKIRPQSGRKKETGWLSRLAREFSKPFKKDADD